MKEEALPPTEESVSGNSIFGRKFMPPVGSVEHYLAPAPPKLCLPISFVQVRNVLEETSKLFLCCKRSLLNGQ